MTELDPLPQQLLTIVDDGRRTGTHKLLTLLALLDVAPLAMQGDTGSGVDVPVEEVAASLLRLAWHHGTPMEGGVGSGGRLSQLQAGGRNELVEAAERCRSTTGAVTADVAAATHPRDHRSAVSRIVTVLVRDPLPRLQPRGGGEHFLFPAWEPAMSVRRLQEQQGRHDVAVSLLPGVARRLTSLGPLLRPILEAALVTDVVRWNRLDTDEERVRRLLFGASRTSWPAGLREGLLDLQRGRCFYEPDGPRLAPNDAVIDHVLPWSRSRLDAVPNLVVTTERMNSSKSDVLPSRRLVERWLGRIDERAELATGLELPPMLKRTRRLAAATYAASPVGVPTWDGRDSSARRLAALGAVDRAWIVAAAGSHGDAVLAADTPGSYGV